jgi:hypothetical protein
MSSWQNSNLMKPLKWQVNELTHWQNGKLAKCQVDNTLVDQMTSWWNGTLTKCQNSKLVKSFANQTANW